jgi:hypothetical protein
MPLSKSLIIFWRKISYPVIFAGSFFFFLTVFFIIKAVFSISVIEIAGSQDIKGLKNLQGQLIFFVFRRETEKKLHDLNPEVKTIQLIKIYPNKILINVKKYQGLALFEVDNGYFFLSKDGRILEKNRKKKESLPIIHYYQKFHFNEYNIGDKLQYEDVLDCLFFADKFRYLEIKIETIDINGLDMLIFNSREKKYIFTTNKEKELQYQEFKTIIERFKIERTEFESIDLRFEKPIIRFR